ncbi:ribosomal-protein-alanine N-acetyltransferase [Terribacillus aidingensis]|uniref:Ribosomal-protein-alanine N-acetyltransferase n=1 Tax=Terribacillus aidingensis TaxID=586416 RepID=A0A285P431_9BACI|nr:GNAT family N-acetyltransferase [Terribacillus aidingensis]SNZ14621.1 ribosomal-protein-alanine N-acetyltransferase [Terribacillus aidingensis]
MGKYQMIPMAQSEAEHITAEWKYDGMYHFYNLDQDEEDLALFLDPEARKDKVFAVKEGEELVGFAEVMMVNNIAEIGFGMRPDLTGKGLGHAFVSFLVETIHDIYCPDKITLAVATFNQRAITLYKRIGFQETARFDQATNGDVFPFVQMVLHT